MELSKQIKLVNTLNQHEKLRAIVKGLQILHNDNALQPIETIRKLELPLNYHLWITANYTDLMQIKFNN